MDIAFVVGWINLFFVPMLPVYRYYKESEQPLEPSLELLFRYAIAMALLIPMAKAVAFLPGRLIAHGTIPLESGYYTLAALIAAWLLPYLARLAGSVSARAMIEKNQEPSDDEDTSDEAAG